ncbi:MAG: hypothetical protein ACOY3M_05035 [Patescibacteria group bacterium]
MKRNIRSVLVWIGLFCVALLPLSDLLNPGFPVTHDGQDHIARIANFYRSLSEGNIVPRWAANLNWGYGHPILMFLYPLPSYVGSLFHFLGFSFVDSTKLVFASGFIASILAMYLWASASWGVAAGVTAAVLYGFAPYRFIDLYVRGAIGEHMAFIFPPIIAYGLLLLSNIRKGWGIAPGTVIAVGVACLILAHNALSIMFLPILAWYAIYLTVHETKLRARFLVIAAIAVGWGFLLSAFYWVPGFFEGKYTLRDIVTAGEFAGRFVPWTAFIYSPWSYGGGNELSKWLGAGPWLALIVGFFLLEKNSKYQKLLIACILLLFFTLFAMTQLSSPLWNTVTILQKFQFPWRLLSVTTFLLAVIGALAVVLSSPKRRRQIAVFLCIVGIITTVPMWRAKEYKQYPESFFTGIYNSTTDTGESSPIWSVRFMERRPESAAYLIPSEGRITQGIRTSTVRSYHVETTGPVRFVENTLYFPGWRVTINGAPLEADALQFQDPSYRGLMTFDLDPGSYDIRFVFSDTKLRSVANGISAASLVILAALGTIALIWRKRMSS